jgi:hypothetical protein
MPSVAELFAEDEGRGEQAARFERTEEDKARMKEELSRAEVTEEVEVEEEDEE